MGGTIPHSLVFTARSKREDVIYFLVLFSCPRCPHCGDHHELRSLLHATTTTSPHLSHWKTFRSWYFCSTFQFTITCMCILFAHLLFIIIPASCSVWEYHPHLTMEGTGSETMASQTLLFILVTWGSWETADLHSAGPRWSLGSAF